jgi:hypothetical protein
LVITAVISGCEGWEEIENFRNDELDCLRQYLPIEEVSSDDATSRIFQIIEPKNFRKFSLNRWKVAGKIEQSL